eukprot:NODE_10666_length_236_cov_2.042781_g9925_i0.p2 GENE.NODE_10666_length_236_cov_2.042781_g9925_i0~~NODE_10666_length_236_cov_2.042781_g9925_i0.p2  ORF type:complete len:61 (-),score=4.95 NODE_10666_length_236_cov_2.042781_g9925_i0:3-185(-)
MGQSLSFWVPGHDRTAPKGGRYLAGRRQQSEGLLITSTIRPHHAGIGWSIPNNWSRLETL